jgi:hypothetical protein
MKKKYFIILGGFGGDSLISSSYSSATVIVENYGGGIVGYLYSSNISNSYTTSLVTGNMSIGGLVGRQTYSSNVENSFSLGSIDANHMPTSGGLIGTSLSGSTIVNSYWNNASSNSNNSIGLGSNVGVITIQDNLSYFYGNSRAPMSSWDTNIWDFYNSTLPHLAFENYFSSVDSGTDSISSLFPSFGVVSLVLTLGILGLFLM